MTSIPGELTFEVNSRLLAGGLAASDDEVREAMRLAFRHLRLVVEPGRRCGAGGSHTHGRRLPGPVAKVRPWRSSSSGGNVDPGLLRRRAQGAKVASADRAAPANTRWLCRRLAVVTRMPRRYAR
jgi:threonine dehydratase